MSKQNHTPGPWDVRGARSFKVIFGKGGDIAEIRNRDNYPNSQMQADACLIAAAPEMFSALEAFLEAEALYAQAMETRFENPDERRRARARAISAQVIAKEKARAAIAAALQQG